MTYRVPGLVVFLGSLLGCSHFESPASSVTPAAFNADGAQTIEFSLPDMMCEDGCAMAVKDILDRQPGVKDVAVDFEGKTATVAIDESTFDSERALAELVDKGFLKSAIAGSDAAATPAAGDTREAPQPAALSSPSD